MDQGTITDLEVQTTRARRWRRFGVAAAVAILGFWIAIGSEVIVSAQLDGFVGDADLVVGVVDDTSGAGTGDLMVRYTYHDQPEVQPVETYSAAYHEGDTVVVAVNPDDPTDVRLPESDKGVNSVLEVIGAIAFVVGVIASVVVAVMAIPIWRARRSTSGSDRNRPGTAPVVDARGDDVPPPPPPVDSAAQIGSTWPSGWPPGEP